ncbi:hypothetical protein KQI41_12985 [Tissierella pigra]|uniref:Uncharacterized protein n=1 Tax=Tissierella pigra TaxID=2607614 RepID=A0A6N7XY79_9FIRM|nr:hypothetical protein [Tissierella pigra]MBU5427302.1 hypothetical protein [Tissierella pigra]MSU01445.1 hypothetical protein [Tissierella pigra]
MKDIDRDEIDMLLKISLSPSVKVDERLNQELKKKLKTQSSKEKSLSIWWLPMVISIFMTMVASTIAFIFIPYGILQLGVLMFLLLTMIFSIVLTAIGVKYFELKKGAVICL